MEFNSVNFGTYSNTEAASGKTATTKTTSKNSLDMNDFLQLLAAQLRYQDMNNPMDNAEMMSQLTQMATVNAMNSMTEMLTSVAEVSTITYAASMIGKELTVVESVDASGEMKTVTGLATGAGFYNGLPCVFIEGKAYALSQIMVMGSTGSKEDGDTSTDGNTSV
ncbi:flagellar hook assembly protein FlgD [Lachnospiraceae bacterium LCP25S3_G4]